MGADTRCAPFQTRRFASDAARVRLAAADHLVQRRTAPPAHPGLPADGETLLPAGPRRRREGRPPSAGDPSGGGGGWRGTSPLAF